MLCFVYQRTNFIEKFFLVPLKETIFQYEDLEVLYGFGYMDGRSKETIKPIYSGRIENVKPVVAKDIQLFSEMTTVDNTVAMETTRDAFNILCKRIRKSDCYLPKVNHSNTFRNVSVEWISKSVVFFDNDKYLAWVWGWYLSEVRNHKKVFTTS